MKRYSYSRLETYENCPLQFKLRYIDRIKSDTESVEAFMGSRVHESLEKLYRDKLMEKTCSLEDLIDFYHSNWDKNLHEGVIVVREGYSLDNYREIGKRCLESYYHRYFPFDHARTIALEMPIEVPLGVPGIKFVGFIDRLDQREDGTYEIHDYKTSSTLPHQAKIDQDKQLALYQLGIESLWDDVRDVDLVWHYLAFDKELRSKREREKLEMIKKEVISIIHEIEATDSFEPRESPLCGWCGYQDLCPLKKHTFKVSRLPPDAFIKEDGVQLVNRYIEVKNQMKALKQEEEQLKNAIYEYAAREGVNVINGSGYRVRIRVSKKPKYPSISGDRERYSSLVEVLKHAGIWEEVSKLDSNRLVELIEEGRIEEEVVREIKAYEEIVEDKRIFTSRIKGVIEK